MPTTSATISLEKISQYLVSNDIAKGNLFGKKLNPYWDIILYMERKGLEWSYSQSSTYEDIYAATQYNYWLCYKTNKAAYILANGSGGTIAPVVPIDDCCLTIYPIFITAADLDEDGNYNNSRIVGDNVIVFFNDNDEKWHRAAGDWFEYTTTGIKITAAYDETYTWIIQKLGVTDSQPANTPTLYNYNLTENTEIENISETEDGKTIIVAIKPNGFSYTWGSVFAFNDSMPEQPGATGVNTIQLYTFSYSAAINKLICVNQAINTPY